MDSENQQGNTAPEASTNLRSTAAFGSADCPPSTQILHSAPDKNMSETYPTFIDNPDPSVILDCIYSGQVWMVNSRRRNGLILYKEFYAEFAGPGAAVGGSYDQDCRYVIPVGNLALIRPESHKERQNAYLIRRQWLKLTQQFTDQSAPLQRAQMILNQFETYFDQPTIARVPDDAFAMLVGVLPYSIRLARRTPGKLNVKVKT